MIISNVKIHDRLSFEAKLNFLKESDQKKYALFQTDMYLFAPYNLDVSAQNYSRNDFYKALKLNIRYASPVVNFFDLIKGKNNPYSLLEEKLNEIAEKKEALKSTELLIFTKRFCSVFRSALRKEIFKTAKRKDEKQLAEACTQIAKQTRKIRNKFRDLCRLPIVQNNSKINKVFLLADEYQSLTVEDHFSLLINIIKKKKQRTPESVSILKETLFEELDYRFKRGYLSVGNKKIKGEEVLHRKSRLKKFVESNLFLNIETKKDGVLLEQILFSLAAGMAMVFSTGVAFASQQTYGNFTLPFFIALVISYMFKDRIKEVMRIYFDKKQRKLHHDYKTIVYDQNSKRIGSIKESFRFEKKRHVPERILKQREKMRTTEIGEIFQEDSILVYRNLLKISDCSHHSGLSSPGLTEIIRFNINDFTLKMDDSEKWIYVKTKEGWKKSVSDRIYYMNLIFRFQFNNQMEYACYKLRANRTGIKHLKKLKV